MPPSPARPINLALPLAAQWTLHHVLLERLDRERTTADPTGIEPPPLAVYTAFETLETGETRVTPVELEACLDVVADAHHQPAWATERGRLEGLLQTLTRALERTRSSAEPSPAAE